jgi:UDPglucose 6-dehydrogenase
VKMAVLGSGYLGTVYATVMASLGHQVVAIDVDEQKIDSLNAAEPAFHEPGLKPLLIQELASGRLRFTTDAATALKSVGIIFICVGTPQSIDGNSTDLKFLYESVDAITCFANAGALVVGKSTVPVGTAAQLAVRLSEYQLDLAWSPEFLREGEAIRNAMMPDRIIVGVNSSDVEMVLREVYKPFSNAGVKVIFTDFHTTELSKLAANAFLATKISFVNAMAEICDSAGGDVLVLAGAIGCDERIGQRFLQPGIGFGGGCLAKDLRSLISSASRYGVDNLAKFLEQVDEINLRQRHNAVQLVEEMCRGPLLGKKICILGIAFKPNTDDIRDSAAIGIALTLKELGATVRIYDPRAMKITKHHYPMFGFGSSVMDAAYGADIVLHLTDWPEFLEIEPSQLGTVVQHKRILDGRNALNSELWMNDGWSYRALGRRTALSRSGII